MAKSRNFLFICKGNDARSQMAEGFARALANGPVNVYSAGVQPKGLNQYAVDVMAELGIEITRQATHGFKSIPVNKIDTIISLSSDNDALTKVHRKQVTAIQW